MSVGGTSYLVLAHADPEHVRRLVSALAPAPVVLHCDARTPEPDFRAMADSGAVLARRHASPWASWGAAAAEIDGIRTALDVGSWDHLAVLQGSDYPLRSPAGIAAALADVAGRSVTPAEPLPRAAWGGHGGLDRLRYPHWAVRRHMIRLPIPRPLPTGVALAGGAVNKILDRDHARLVVALHDRRADLRRRWRHSWAPDETYVPTLLRTALRDTGRLDEIVERSVWFTDWGTGRAKSPAWLEDAHWPALRAAADADPPALFARKFETVGGSALLARIDRELHAARVAS